jgi:1-acyl-sn-glycerol-3-phosphate acyltransferase
MNSPVPAVSAPPSEPRAVRRERATPAHDRSRLARAWYQLVRWTAVVIFASFHRRNVPDAGGALLVCNHLSHFDVFVIGVPIKRPLNYVARSSLFVPILGPFMRSVGAFAIQREGMGAQGLKETLKRVRAGGMVLLFPEGTRSRDGDLAPLKSGIAVLAARTSVPIVPAGLAGTFEAWPRSELLPRCHPIRIHYGRPIAPAEIAGLDTDTVTALIRSRILEAQQIARQALARDLGLTC